MSDILKQIEAAILSDSNARRIEALDAAYVEIERLRRLLLVVHQYMFDGDEKEKVRAEIVADSGKDRE